MNDTEFIGDLQALLRPDVGYDAQQAYPLIYQTFIDKMEGKRDWVNLHFPKNSQPKFLDKPSGKAERTASWKCK